MHSDRENIFAVGPEERRMMSRKLLVELERFRACDDDGSQRPIDEQTSFFGTIVNSADMVKQEPPAVSGISPKSNNLDLVLFPWQRRFFGTVQILQSWHSWLTVIPVHQRFESLGFAQFLADGDFGGRNRFDHAGREFFP